MLIRPMQIARGLLADLNPAYPDAVRGLLFDEQALAEIGRPGSSRLSLSKVHALRKRRRYVTLSILAPANETRRAIRPMLREVYPLATAVLRARGEATLLDFASQMEELVPLWPRELRPEYLAASLQRDRRRWLATLVEFCDCSGRLLDLLRFCQESPQDPIARLASICEEYERQLMSLVCER